MSSDYALESQDWESEPQQDRDYLTEEEIDELQAGSPHETEWNDPAEIAAMEAEWLERQQVA